MIKVLYHAGCPDGFMAAYIAWLKFSGLSHESEAGDKIEFIPVSYGQEFDVTKCLGDNVYMLDFSFPYEKTQELLSVAGYLTILDHHKTAQEVLSQIDHPNSTIIFDMERSGVTIAWDYFFGNGSTPKEFVKNTRPWYVNYTEDRDLWRFALPYSKEINAWLMTCYTMPLEDFHILIKNSDMKDAMSAGAGIRRKILMYCEAMMAFVQEANILGEEMPIINASYPDTSDLLDYMIEHLKRGYDGAVTKAACAYRVRKDGKVQFSLRSRSDFDVAVLAQKFGGGGHKNASGFELDSLDTFVNTDRIKVY